MQGQGEQQKRATGDGDTQQKIIMPPPIDIIEFESSGDGESTAPKTAASSQHVDYRRPHQLSNAGRQDQDRILAQNEDHQHGESCRDNERGRQHDGNNTLECRGNNSIAGRDESALKNSIMRGLRIVFLIIAVLILLGEVPS